MTAVRARTRALALLVPLTVTAALAATGPAQAAATKAPVGRLTQAQLHQLAASDRTPAARAARAADVARSSESERKGLPSFSSSYTVDGTTYPYTMLGAAPASGRTTKLKTVVVPLRMAFKGFTTDVTLEPSFAVRNILRSPIYQDARYVNGRGQFADQLQRATFWNQMDSRRRWHTLLAEPEVTHPFTITVTPDTGQLDTIDGSFIGNMNIDLFDAELHKILPKLHLAADETPLFVTQAVTADALGYHDAFLVPAGGGRQRLQTLMWTSWLDPAVVGTLLGDVSTINHEVAEWYDDPFIDNAAPLWAFPPFNAECGDNPFVEVGDPAGNGPDFDQFPTVPLRLNGYTYHLQTITTLQWFSREVPSSAFHGLYSFPDPTQITTPSVDCPPPPPAP